MMITRDVLFDEYVVKRKPMHQIAKEQGIAVGTVFNYIKKYEIKSRKAMSEETRQKISRANTGNTFRKGFSVSQETKDKLSRVKKGKYFRPSAFGGHIKKRHDGYNTVYCPDHPRSTKDGYVMEHVLIMENHIGRYLKNDEVVHHKNKVRDDNRIENLQLMTFKEHAALHMKERWAEKKGVMTYQ